MVAFLNVACCLGGLRPDTSDGFPLCVSLTWAFSPCSFCVPSPCPSSPTHLCLILCPSLSLLIEILLSREDVPSSSHNAHDPVFYDSPLCGPCSFIQHVTSSCARLLYAVLGVSFPGEESGLPRPTSGDYSFTSAQWLSKRPCVLTVQVMSPTLPCRAVCFLSRFRSHFPTRQVQLLLA